MVASQLRTSQKRSLRMSLSRRFPDGSPPTETLEGDLSRFLEILDSVVQSDEAERPVWIFQANPKYYDIDRALRELSRIEWTGCVSTATESTKATLQRKEFSKDEPRVKIEIERSSGSRCCATLCGQIQF